MVQYTTQIRYSPCSTLLFGRLTIGSRSKNRWRRKTPVGVPVSDHTKRQIWERYREGVTPAILARQHGLNAVVIRELVREMSKMELKNGDRTKN